MQTNAQLGSLHAAGAGFVFNDFTTGPTGASDNVLHHADCPWVARMLDRADPQSRPSVPKMYFGTLDEAQSWLVPNRGPEGRGWKRCATCQPGRTAASQKSGKTGALASAVATPVSGSWPVQAAFAMPASQPLRLPVQPRLASWNKAGDPDQVRLAEYLDIADGLLRPGYQRLTGPLALRLDVGLLDDASLLEQRDLDNYLFPLATRLSKTTSGVLACVWGTKQHSDSSYVRIEQATPATASPPFDCCYTAHTDTSAQSEAFKEQIRDQLSSASPLPPGPVHMQLFFTVGPGRNWLNLWKPTIDALGRILGASAAGPWAPLDGRIVDLALHCRVDPSIGNDLRITIAAKHIRVRPSDRRHS